jgi:hypothetical protein
MNRFLSAGLVAVLFFAIACRHAGKDEQLAALDSAYHAGLLTKDEYHAKRIALTGAAPAAAPVSAPAPSPAAVPPATADQPQVQTAPAEVARNADSLPPPRPAATPAAPPSGHHASEAEPAPLAGCEDAEYKSGGKKGAEERFFAASPDLVRHAAVSALDSLDFNIRKNSNKEIEATRKRHIGVLWGAGGERVILSFHESSRSGRSGTRVTGQTRKNFVGHASQRTWTDAVLAQMACKLRQSSQ